MAIDTRNKRASMMGLGNPSVTRLKQPTGTVDSVGRAMLLHLYAGIPLAVGTINTPNKRASMMSLGRPYVTRMQSPTGTIGLVGRTMLAHLYAGLLPGGTAPVAVQSTGFGEPIFGSVGFGEGAGLASYKPSLRLAMLLGAAEPAIAPKSLFISLNNRRGTANFRRRDARPVPLSPFKIGIGSLSDPDLIFRGKIEDSSLVLDEKTPSWDCVAVDSSFEFNGRLAWGFYDNVDAGLIAKDLIAKFVPTFNSTFVQTGLPAITILFDGQTMDTAMNRLATAIGGYYYRDLSYGAHLFVTEAPAYTPDILDENNNTILIGTLRWSANVNQVRNKVIGVGGRTSALSALNVGETSIPVRDTTIFDNAPNTVLIGGSQRVNYTTKLPGGGGSLVGPGVTPSSAPVLAPVAGSGIESGTYPYTYTWVVSGGETMQSPAAMITLGNLAPPSVPPTLQLLTGGSLSIGTYQYAVTHVNAAGETIPGPTNSITTRDVPNPTVAPTVATSPYGGGSDTMDAGGVYYYKYTYVLYSGEETLPSPVSAAYVAVDASGGGPNPSAYIPWITVQNSTDVAVAYIQLYRTLNGTTANFYKVYSTYSGLARNGNNFTGGTGIIPDGAADRWLTFLNVGAPIVSTALLRRVNVTLPTGGPTTTGRNIQRTTVNGSQLKLAQVVANNISGGQLDGLADASLGANAPTTNTAAANRVAVTGVALGPLGTLNRKVYRSAKLQQTIANNTSTAGVTDATPNAGLGANAPTADTSGLSTVIVTGQGFYGSGVTFPTNGNATLALTAAPLFTSASYTFVAADIGASVFIKAGTNWTPGSYLITGISAGAAILAGPCAVVTSPSSATWGVDYSAMLQSRLAWNDLVIDASLATKMTSAANPFGVNCLGNAISIIGGLGFTLQRVIPLSLTGSTVTCDKNIGLLSSTGGQGAVYGTPESQIVLAGSSVLKLASAGPFSASGGWVILGNGMIVRYGGVAENTLTGIPATGIGSLLTTVPYGTQATPAASLAGIPSSGPGSITSPVLVDDTVALYCERNDFVSQAAVAAIENLQGGTSTGVYEFKIENTALVTQTSLNARCDADLLQYASVNGIIKVTYTTYDRKSLVGRPVPANWPTMGLVGTFIIQQVDISFDEAGFTPPMFAVTASSVLYSLEDLLAHAVTQ